MNDYYGILGIDKSASPEDIKKAYRALSKKYHPDTCTDDKTVAEEKFKQISEAYSILSNPDKRREYDNPFPQGGFGGMGFSPFGDIFGNMRQQSHPRRPDMSQPMSGKGIVFEAEIPLGTILFGGKYNLSAAYTEGCPECNTEGFSGGEDCQDCSGTGFVQHVERRAGFMSSSTGPCRKCQGRGKINVVICESCNGSGNRYVSDKKISFDIPAGTRVGTRFLSRGTGRIGLNGGMDGDVVLIVSNIKMPDLNKLTPDNIETLKNILEEINN